MAQEIPERGGRRAKGRLRRAAAQALGNSMPNVGGIAGDRLKSFIERIERLSEEKKALSNDIAEVFAEARGAGFDVKIMRQVIRLRRMDKDDLDEQDALLDVYKRALGMLPGEAAGSED